MSDWRDVKRIEELEAECDRLREDIMVLVAHAGHGDCPTCAIARRHLEGERRD